MCDIYGGDESQQWEKNKLEKRGSKIKGFAFFLLISVSVNKTQELRF